jgi:hypothetical protein
VKKHDDYIAGAHRYWLHFFCGIVAGAIIGSWIGFNAFNGAVGISSCAAIAAGIFAFACACWGDRAWLWVIERLPWLT